ncbi:MAG: hypothetical protein NW226_04360 [Microscillaceae bacterium]|nr:hypothetical protein [Microscillaceae bacterium]
MIKVTNKFSLICIMCVHLINISFVIKAQQTDKELSIKKLYLSKDKTIRVAHISFDDLPLFKIEYNAILNQQLSSINYKVYDLDNQKILTEDYEDALLYAKEDFFDMNELWKKSKHTFEGMLSVKANFQPNINDLIEQLANFMMINLEQLDRSPESMKTVSDFFEEYCTSAWLARDLSENITAYYGEVIIKKYPEAKWRMKEDTYPGIHYPYVFLNEIEIDFFQDIYIYLGCLRGKRLSLYERLEGEFAFIDQAD